MANDVVFIGGAIAPLLQSELSFDGIRATKDVDGVVASTNYSDSMRLSEDLRSHGFQQSFNESGQVNRWISPDGDILNLVPAGEHFGGSGQQWDQHALESRVIAEFEDRTQLGHANAPAEAARIGPSVRPSWIRPTAPYPLHCST